MFLCLTVTSIHLHILFRMYDNVHVLRWKPKKSFFFLVARTLRGEDGVKGPAIKEENNEFLSRKKKKQPLKIIFFF